MFNKLLKEFEKEDKARENIIILSRGIIKLSKKIISAVHNEDIKEAEKYKILIDEEIKSIQKQNNNSTGSYTIAIQEYVEAILLLEYAKTGKILTHSDFNCNPQEYLLGLCDFVGELQRRSVLKISKGDEKTIHKIHSDVSKIYDGLLNFSFRGDLRKKFDSVKYIMIKMEDMLLQLKLKK